jgi:hypothetical protein
MKFDVCKGDQQSRSCGWSDEIYVNLKLGPNCLVVVSASFQRER